MVPALLALVMLVPLPGPMTLPVILERLPAVVTFYSPELGGINCDHDCSTIATGTLEDWMYGEYMACHEDMLGMYVTFEGIGTWRCMDTGPAITVAWSRYYNSTVLFFDALMHEEPEWNFVKWEAGYWCVTSYDVGGDCP